MKQMIFWIAQVLCMAAIAAGCNKNKDLPLYENEPGIYFYTGTNTNSLDSIGYNFVLLPAGETSDTVYLPLRISGFAANKDRVVNIQIRDSSTAKAGVDFKLGPAVVHAGRYSDSVPVYVYRTIAMTSTTLKLYADLLPSADFKLAYQEHLSFKISITDRVVPPAWTFTYSSTFGEYSNVKFRFMVSVLQITTFSGLLPSQTAAMASKCKLALADYEAANGPLIDENGKRVVFP